MKTFNEFLIKSKINAAGPEFQVYTRHPYREPGITDAYILIDSIEDYEYITDNIKLDEKHEKIIDPDLDRNIRKTLSEKTDKSGIVILLTINGFIKDSMLVPWNSHGTTYSGLKDKGFRKIQQKVFTRDISPEFWERNGWNAE